MSERVTMPALGESVTEGTVTRWLKSVGDSVAVDEPLLEVSTDKVDTEIPSPVAGTLQEILVQEDETADVGADLCVIGDGAAADSGSSAAGEAPAPSSAEGSSTESGSEQAVPSAASEEPAKAPVAETKPADAAPSGDASQSAQGSVSGGEKVVMPALGESVTEGTVTRWLKQEGDDVAVDEPLLEVSTDKVDTEIPSPVAGKLTKILVQEDETVPVGADLAIVGGDSSGGGEQPQQSEQAQQDAPQQSAPADEPAPTKDEAQPDTQVMDPTPRTEVSTEEAKQESPAQAQQAPAQSQQPQEGAQNDGSDASAYVTPLVRKLAADNGVDLASLKGTGVGGRIRKQDVLDAAAAKTAAPAAPSAAPTPAPASASPSPAVAVDPAVAAKRGTTEKMSRLRKVIAQRMIESLDTSAQLTAVVEVDMSRVAALRAKHKNEFQQREGAKLSFLPFISLATVETLKAFPNVNASVEGDEIIYHGDVHLGIAVDTPKGLIVPVIKGAGDLNVAGLAKKVADLADRTRSNKVSPDELSGGTFTITNIGSAGTLFDTPIINQPQVAILGTGAIVKRPVVVTDEFGADSIAVRHMMYLCLTYDHRVVDGADAGRFLTALKQRLEEGVFDV